MEFSIKNEINSFHLFNNSTVVKNKLLPHTAAGPWRALNVMAQPSAGRMVSETVLGL
jgi:hypothetical protein